MSQPADNAKVVLITGCSAGGLGASLAETFAAKGAKVFASARNVSKMDSLSAGIEKVALDVTSDESVAAAVQTVIEKAGRIDILVNNAGGNRVGAFLDVPLQDIEDTFQTNVFGVMRVTKAVAPHMAKRKSGLIINVGSLAGNLPSPWWTAYSSSKAALHAHSDIIDMELRPFGIKVLLLAPGFIESNIRANTAAKHTEPPADSLYGPWRKGIDARLEPNPKSSGQMTPTEFARRTVEAALAPNPPSYMSIGGQVTAGWIMTLLPRSWRLNQLWKIFDKRS